MTFDQPIAGDTSSPADWFVGEPGGGIWGDVGNPNSFLANVLTVHYTEGVNTLAFWFFMGNTAAITFVSGDLWTGPTSGSKAVT